MKKSTEQQKEEVTKIVKHVQGESPEPLTLELDRGQKGTYGWTIKVKGNEKTEMLRQIEDLNSILTEKYGGNEDGKKGTGKTD